MSTTSTQEVLRHELLDQVAKFTEQTLLDMGVEADRAEQAGVALADMLATEWGGQTVCVPKDWLYKLSLRDMDIWNDFTGGNVPQLARKYRMTTRGIYKILDRVRKRETDKRQGQLSL